jgi:hypothetical protein
MKHSFNKNLKLDEKYISSLSRKQKIRLLQPGFIDNIPLEPRFGFLHSVNEA